MGEYPKNLTIFDISEDSAPFRLSCCGYSAFLGWQLTIFAVGTRH